MASESNSRIENWLQGLKQPTAPDLINPTDSLYAARRPDLTRKRKRRYNSQFPSPPTSSCHPRPLPITQGQTMASSFTSPKKRKTTEDNRDTPLTPWATRRYDDDTSSTSSLPRSESLSQTSARSPTKISPFLQLDPVGFEIGPLDLDDPDMPEAAKQLIEEIDTIAAGHHVVPAILKGNIDRLKKTSRSYVSFRDYVYTDKSEEDDKPSMDRFLEDVLKTVAVAQECQRIEQDETGWNHIVHSPLLDTILDRQSQNITGFVPCMSASILPEWRLKAKLGTRIDYAIVVNPEHDPQSGAQAAIQRLRFTLPEASANHTGFPPLRHRPIGISIETKRYGGDERKEEFQLGIWHSAQWKLLAKQAGDGVAHLAFIPGIIVQGHDWKLVVTTYKEGKTC
uniref:PD-(D/E)XK nuclease-like domain-containing protein n=1 Tax=Bionectria ochroleuca TaxID=29856 RepID=A0A0B7KRZ7_BIOOC